MTVNPNIHSVPLRTLRISYFTRRQDFFAETCGSVSTVRINPLTLPTPSAMSKDRRVCCRLVEDLFASPMFGVETCTVVKYKSFVLLPTETLSSEIWFPK